jgi:hypothetical protein
LEKTNAILEPHEDINVLRENHPLASIDPDKWNNIPGCIVKSFKAIVNHCINKDSEKWERKASLNE